MFKALRRFLTNECDIYPGKGQGGIARKFWEEKHGLVPRGLCVLHRCDHNTAGDVCINLRHMFIGTQQDNIRDAMRKGRLHGIGSVKEKVPYEILSEQMKAAYNRAR